MERNTTFIVILMLLLMSQVIVLSSRHADYGGYHPDLQEIERRVMAEHYRLCPVHWVQSYYDESVTCIGDDTTSATVYHSVDGNWVAYGWGLKGGDRYKTKAEAKRSLEKQIVRWNQKPPLPIMREVSRWKIWVMAGERQL